MKTKALLIFISFLIANTLLAQDLKQFKSEEGKWGLQDEKGNIRLAPQYDNIMELETLGESKYYVINNGGTFFNDTLYEEYVVELYDPDNYDNIYDSIFYEAINVPCIFGGLSGIVNPQGKIVLKPEYNSFSMLHWYSIDGENSYFYSDISDTAKIKGTMGLSLTHSRIINSRHSIIAKLKNKWGLVDFEGNVLTKFSADTIKPGINGVYKIYQNNKTGFAFIGEGENVIIKPQFDNILELSANDDNNAIFYVVNNGGRINNYTYHYTIERYEYDEYSYADDNDYTFEIPYIVGGKFGIISPEGKLVLKPVYDKLFVPHRNSTDSYINSYFFLDISDTSKIREWLSDYGDDKRISDLSKPLIANKKGKWGVVDYDGNQIIDFKNKNIDRKSGHFLVTSQNGDTFILKIQNGKIIYYPTKYDWVNSFNNGFASVREEGKYGIIDSKGKEVIPLKYSDIWSFNNKGIAYVKENGVWYSVNKEKLKDIVPVSLSGTNCNSDIYKHLIGYKYESISDFSNDRARIKLNGKYGFINSNGKVVIPLEFDWASEFNNGYAIVFSGKIYSSGSRGRGKYNLIDVSGNLMLERDYEKISKESSGLYLVKRNGKYGYINSTGEIVIPIKYDDAYDFNKGFATVEIDNKYGRIDIAGKVVIPFQYEKIHKMKDFETSLIVKKNKKYGHLDFSGKEIIPIKYDDVYYFLDGYASVLENNKYSLVDTVGNSIYIGECDEITGFTPELDFVKKDGKYYFIDKRKRIQLPTAYHAVEEISANLLKVKKDDKWGFVKAKGNQFDSLKYDEILKFTEGFAIVKQNKKYGFINDKGVEVIPIKYDYVSNYSGGLALVFLGKRYRYSADVGKYGFIDKSGSEIIPLIYNHADNFSNEYAKVGKNNKYGFIDKSGKEIVTLTYDYINVNSRGYIEVKSNNKYGIIDKTGKEIIPVIYDKIEMQYDLYEYVKVKKDDKYGFIDKNGKEVTPIVYDFVSKFYHGFAKVFIGEMSANYPRKGKFGFIGRSGKEITPVIYDYASGFSNGFAMVKKMDKYGFIDKSGKEITPLIYDNIRDFSKGYAEVEKGGKSGIIDTMGREIAYCKYDLIERSGDGRFIVFIGKFNNWHMPMEGQYGFISKAGKEIILPGYDKVFKLYENGTALVYKGDLDEIMDEGKFGIVDSTGKEIISCKYDWIYNFKNNVARVFIGKMESEGYPLEGKFSLVDESGKMLIPFEYDWIYRFYNGLAKVKNGDKYGFIDPTGKIAIPLIYDEADDFYKYKSKVKVTKDGKTFYIDKVGNKIE